MLISPHQSIRDLAVDLKDDHFNSEQGSESSPRNTSKPCFVPFRERRISFGEEPLQFGESQEFCATSFSTSPPDGGFYGNSFPHNGTSPPYPRRQRKVSADYGIPEEIKENGVTNGQSMPEKQPSFSMGQKMGAFAPYRETTHQKEDEEEEDDVPFMNLLLHSECYSKVDANANKPANGVSLNGVETHNGADNRDCHSDATNGDYDEDNVDFQQQEANDNVMTGSGSNKSGTSHGSAPEDFVMVELKTPFAGTDGNSDLGKFYRDCQGAPPLTMFESNSDMKEALNEITDQLVHFEENAKDFDDFVNSLATAAEV